MYQKKELLPKMQTLHFPITHTAVCGHSIGLWSFECWGFAVWISHVRNVLFSASACHFNSHFKCFVFPLVDNNFSAVQLNLRNIGSPLFFKRDSSCCLLRQREETASTCHVLYISFTAVPCCRFVNRLQLASHQCNLH